jgi:histidinol-phosphate aminotransferase
VAPIHGPLAPNLVEPSENAERPLLGGVYPPFDELLTRIRPAVHLPDEEYRTPRRGGQAVGLGGMPLALDLNEGPAAPQALADELSARIRFDRDLHIYPDEHATKLRQAVAAHVGHGDAAHVAVGPGSVAFYQQVPLAFGMGPAAGGRVLVFKPAYGAYFPVVASTGAELVAPMLDRDGAHLDAMPKLVDELQPDVVILCSPNNPTGEVLPNEVIAAVCGVAPGLVMVDEAYGPFSSADAVELLPRFPNLVVTGSSSKAFSLASLRLGWALAHPNIIRTLRKVQTPWQVSGPAQLAGILALTTYRSDVLANVRAVVRERARVAERLGLSAGVSRILPSEGNFVTFRTHLSADEVHAAFLRWGIRIRNVSNAMEDRHWSRVSVTASPSDIDAFAIAAGEVLGERPPWGRACDCCGAPDSSSPY